MAFMVQSCILYLQLLAHLKKAYPVKSRINDWVNAQLQTFEVRFFFSSTLFKDKNDFLCKKKKKKKAETSYTSENTRFKQIRWNL